MGEPYGAYGLRIAGLDVVPDGRRAPDAWPLWTMTQTTGAGDETPGMSIWDSTARIGVPGAGEFRLDRERRLIALHATTGWSGEALLHPGLSPAAAVIARWMGRSSLHAAAVVVDGLAWGLLGTRGGGKSTTAALLADLGCPLLTDDLLVVKGETCFAGPATVDLRADAAAHLGGRALGKLGSRERWRKSLPPSPLEAPLAGWVALEWSDGAVEVRPIDVGERIEVLGRHAALPIGGEHLLQLADRPMVRFARPHAPDATVSAGMLADRLRDDPG